MMCYYLNVHFQGQRVNVHFNMILIYSLVLELVTYLQVSQPKPSIHATRPTHLILLDSFTTVISGDHYLRMCDWLCNWCREERH